MEANKEWRRGQKAPYTDRPLTEQEKIFAEEHHDLMYHYMRLHRGFLFDRSIWIFKSCTGISQNRT